VDFGFEVLENEPYAQEHEMSTEIAEERSMENEEVLEEEGVLDLDRILLMQGASRRTPALRRTTASRQTSALPPALGAVVTNSPNITSTRPDSSESFVPTKRRKFLQ
jgi:hypothetical protein